LLHRMKSLHLKISSDKSQMLRPPFKECQRIRQMDIPDKLTARQLSEDRLKYIIRCKSTDFKEGVVDI
jgi:hypothetical protein